MPTLPFNALANSHHARAAWELSHISQPDTSLVVLPQPLNAAAKAYVEGLDYTALRHGRHANHYASDPVSCFYFVWHEGSRHRDEMTGHDFAEGNLTCDYLRTVMPRTTGSEDFFADVALRVRQFENATGSTSLRCELRYSEAEMPHEFFHQDTNNGRYRAGTAYLNRATGFIAPEHLAGKRLNTAQVCPTQPDIAPHIIEPGLHDLYLFRVNRPHCVPRTAAPRFTLIMGAV